MLKNQLYEALKEERNPDRKFIKAFLLLIILVTVPFLFNRYVNSVTSNVEDYKKDNVILKETVRVTQGRNDSLTQVIFNITLQAVIDNDRLSKKIDSVIEKQQQRK